MSLAGSSALPKPYSISALSEVLLTALAFVAHATATISQMGVIKLGCVGRPVAECKESNEVNGRKLK